MVDFSKVYFINKNDISKIYNIPIDNISGIYDVYEGTVSYSPPNGDEADLIFDEVYNINDMDLYFN
jgi:hypothetical protein